MGRPPLGERAMTAAEKMRRYRAKLRNAAPVTKPVAAPAGKPDPAVLEELAQVKAELAQAKARIAELERHAKANTAPPLIDEKPDEKPPRRVNYGPPGWQMKEEIREAMKAIGKAADAAWDRMSEQEREARGGWEYKHKLVKEDRATARAEIRARHAAEEAAEAKGPIDLPPHIQRLPPNHDHGLERAAKPAAKLAEPVRGGDVRYRRAKPDSRKAVPQTKRPRLHRVQ